MSRRIGSWAAPAIIGFAIAGLTVSTPSDVAEPVVVGWAVVASILFLRSTSQLPDNQRRPWRLFGVAGLLIAIGVIARGIHGVVVGIEQPLPSPADVIHVPAYLVFVASAVVVHRRRAARRNSSAWLDATTMTMAFAVLMWVWFYGDFVSNDAISASTRALNATYNAMTLVAMTVFIRIMATPGSRPLSYFLVGSSGLCFMLADFAGTYSYATERGVLLSVALSPISYGLGLSAIRHSSAPEMLLPHKEQEERVGLVRLATVAFSMLSPVAILLTSWDDLEGHTYGAAAFAVILTVCMVYRTARLLNNNQRFADLERLSAAEVSRLAALQSSREVQQALLGSVSVLLADGTHARYARAGSQNEALHLELPPVLQSRDRAAISVNGRALPPLENRLIRSLIRDAGLIAERADSVAESAQHRSQAEANRRIAANERRFRALVQNATDIVIVVGDEGEVTYASEAVANVLGYRPEAFLGRSLEWIVHENDWAWAREYFGSVVTGTNSDRDRELRALHADGHVRLFECVLTDMRHVEGIQGIVVNATDVTAKRSLERDLRDAETTDLLTLQLNRTAFVAETDTAIRRASVTNASIAVAIINIDQFRTVNDGLGPSLADQVLVEVAQAVRRSVRIKDVVARLNGDEFGILMSDGYSAVEAVHAVERVIAEIAKPIHVGGHTLTLRATAGVVLDTDGSNTGVSLLRNADTALDVAKNHHRGETVLFEEAMGEAASERIELRNTLADALRNNDLRLAYQPVVSIETGAIVSMEALARWNHPTRGKISPAVFIPIAESAGLITELGEWALRTACEQVVNWSVFGMDGFSVSVNMSGHQLREENIISRVRTILDETGVDPSRITIEITESVLIDDTDFIAQRISALRLMGLRLAIDDFGTGYSSLSYLTRYEFDVLKIDRSFVIPLGDPARGREREIVKSMIDLARALGAVTIAEGIEEAAEFDALVELNCDYAQGYLFWYPLELEDVAQAYAESRQVAAA